MTLDIATDVVDNNADGATPVNTEDSGDDNSESSVDSIEFEDPSADDDIHED